MLKKGFRLRKKEDFDRVFRSGKPLFFTEIGCRYRLGGSSLRLGFSFSKKHLPRAVDRNRLRRVLSEVFFQLREEWPESDIVFFTLNKNSQAVDIEKGRFLAKNLFEHIKKTKKTIL